MSIEVENLMNLADGQVLYDDLRDRQEDLKIDVDAKAPAIVKSMSGSIVSFSDSAVGIPVKDCTVSIEPVQDLHGYDNPWPAGSGKNLLQNTNETKTVNGLTYTVNADGSVVVNGTASADTDYIIYNGLTLPSGSYILNGCPANGSTSTYRIFATNFGSDIGSGLTFTADGATSTIVRINIKNGTAISNLLFKPMIRLATESDATFAPYSNICPITGWTGVTAYRTGKNLFDKDNVSAKDNVWVDISTKEMKSGGGNKGFVIPIKGEATYTFSYADKNATDIIIASFPETQNVGSIATNRAVIGTTATNKSVAIVTEANDSYLFVKYNNTNVTQTYTDAEVLAGIQIELGETASEYVPYSGTTISVTFPSEAGTVYGGSLDLTTGVLTVNRANVILDGSSDENWDFYSVTQGNLFRNRQSNSPTINSSNVSNWMCNAYKPVANNRTNGTLSSSTIGYFDFIDNAFSNTSEWKAYLAQNPICAVYPLATPVTYQLTPAELTTLLGQNNIWADTGNVAVQYCVDTKSYVDGAIPDIPVSDVQINGTSILSQGVANVPVAGNNVLGTVMVSSSYGVQRLNNSGLIGTAEAPIDQIKGGTNYFQPICPERQHMATFYGLAKVAGADMKNSSNAVGVYTDDAKQSIQTMLGTNTILAPAEQDISNASRAYSVGEMLSAKGKLYKVTSNIAIGDVIIPGNTSGCNCIETTISESFPHDVQVNGTSILSNGIANIPIATQGSSNSGRTFGVVSSLPGDHGINIDAGVIKILTAYDYDIKNGNNVYRPITSGNQHASTFYGLAKAAGDTTQSASNNAVGTYTNNAQLAIQTMLNVPSKTDTVLDTTLSCGRKANTTVGTASFAFGTDVEASGTYSHAEGGGTTASGNCAHAEGGGTTSSGTYSHAEGGGTTASGVCSHAEGGGTLASGSNSHADGTYTIAGHKSQHVFGEYNIADAPTESVSVRGTYVEIVGNGSETNGRSNARTLDWNGNESLAGSLTLGAGTANQVTVTATQLSYLLNITDATGVNF